MQVETSSPVERVVLLYEKVIVLLKEAIEAIERGDIPAKVEAITKADRIIRVLNGSLDMEQGGDVAKALREFYDTLLAGLFVANSKNDVEVLKNMISMLETVKEGWEKIA